MSILLDSQVLTEVEEEEKTVTETEVPVVSRRASLESIDEPELKNITSDSRPSTAVSHKSALTHTSIKTDLATQGTPEHPIEIPQVNLIIKTY